MAAPAVERFVAAAWAAAGAPDAGFEIAPKRLVEITGATAATVS